MNTNDIVVQLSTVEEYNQLAARRGFRSNFTPPSSHHKDWYGTIVQSPSYSDFAQLVHSLTSEEKEQLRFVQVYEPTGKGFSRSLGAPSDKESTLLEAVHCAEEIGKLTLEFYALEGPRSRWLVNHYDFHRRLDGLVLCVRLYLGSAKMAISSIDVRNAQGQRVTKLPAVSRHLYAVGELERIVAVPS